jgi:hypothetical protein
MVSSVKVSDKVTKVYNDVVFGGISWSADETKICFVGENPEVAKYNNPWDLPEEKKEEKEEKDKASESQKDEKEKKDGNEEKEEHWQEEKFLYKPDHGEMLVGKKVPTLFIFDLK